MQFKSRIFEFYKSLLLKTNHSLSSGLGMTYGLFVASSFSLSITISTFTFSLSTTKVIAFILILRGGESLILLHTHTRTLGAKKSQTKSPFQSRYYFLRIYEKINLLNHSKESSILIFRLAFLY